MSEQVENVENVDELNYGDADSESVEYENSGSSSVAPAAAILQALRAATDPEQIKKVESSLYLETGKYKWQAGKVEVKPEFQSGEAKPGDLAKKLNLSYGRFVVNVQGMVYNVEAKSKVGRFFFQYSPDERFAENGQPDFPTQYYIKLVSLFRKKTGAIHKDEEELVKFVSKAMYTMSIRLDKNNRNFLQEFEV